MISNFLCNVNNSILEAMQVINNNSKKVCFVVGDENTLEGVLTDGDIRRAILLGNELQNPVSKILVKDYVYGQEQESISSLLKKLNKKMLPVMHDEKQLTALRASCFG